MASTSSLTTTIAIITTTSPFRVGDYVTHVDGDIYGYITTIDLEQSTVIVRYTIGNMTVNNIHGLVDGDGLNGGDGDSLGDGEDGIEYIDAA